MLPHNGGLLGDQLSICCDRRIVQSRSGRTCFFQNAQVFRFRLDFWHVSCSAILPKRVFAWVSSLGSKSVFAALLLVVFVHFGLADVNIHVTTASISLHPDDQDVSIHVTAASRSLHAGCNFYALWQKRIRQHYDPGIGVEVWWWIWRNSLEGEQRKGSASPNDVHTKNK